MKYVLDEKKGKLFKIEEIELTTIEMRLLMILSDCKTKTYKEIIKFIYENEFYVEKTDKIRLCSIVARLKNKGINIETIYEVGYKLNFNLEIR